MELAQTWETEEEATAAMYEYARQFSERSEDESAHQMFLDSHLVLEVQQGVFAVALKSGENPFTFC